MWRKRNRRRSARDRTWTLPRLNWNAIVVLIATCAGAAASYAGAVWMLDRPIQTIVINGSFKRVSAIQLQGLAEPYSRAGFLDVDLGAIHRSLLALPWVASVEVRRRWPGTLQIEVKEESAYACWGERGLLNSSGKLFLATAEHVPAELPRLRGPSGTEAQVTARYAMVQQQLEHRGLSAVSLSLDERGAWMFETSNGIEVRLGANDVDQRIGRFFAVMDSSLSQLSSDVDYLDMRYPNGFAIGWKKAPPADAARAGEPRPNV